MEPKKTSELESAILNGENVTPEMLVAAQRIEELKAQREAELVRIRKENDEQVEQVEREKAERAEESRQKAAEIADIETRFTGGANLTCQELMALKDHLSGQSDRARFDVDRYKIEPEHRTHLTPRELATRESELKNAQTSVDNLASLYAQVSEILRSMPNAEKKEYLGSLKEKIATLEKREQMLFVYRAENQREFYRAGGDHVELDRIGKKLYALRNELKAADTRDRSEAGAMQSFRHGIRALIKCSQAGKIAIHNAELDVRRIMQECEIDAPLGLLFWKYDHLYPSPEIVPGSTPETPDDAQAVTLDEAQELIRRGALDFMKHQQPGFQQDTHFQREIEKVLQSTGTPYVNRQWWTKIWPNAAITSNGPRAENAFR